MAVKGIIFDVDGVLVNSEPYYFEQRLAYLNSIGVTLSLEANRRFIGSNMNAVLAQIFPQKSLAKRNEIKAGYSAFKAAHPMQFKPMLNTDAPLLLQQICTDCQIGLASAGERVGINRMLAETALTPYFETIISGAETAHNKPAPDVYLAALAALKIAPNEAVAIEDSTLGIAAGKAAGMTVIALQPLDPNYEIDQSAADYRVGSLLEVPTLLAQLMI